MNAAARLERGVALATVLVPFAGFVAAIALLVTTDLYRPIYGWLCAAMYVVSVLGITAGFHRGFTHRSFDAEPWLQTALGISGSLAAQGPLIFWVAAHRRHHQFSDTANDPHSPHLPHRADAGASAGSRAGLRGFLHAHVGWLLHHEPESWMKYAPDLLKQRRACWITRWYGLWVLLGLVAPAAFAGLWTWSWQGAAMGALWGGLVRVFLVHHVTWSINSICHLFGPRPYETGDQSTNNWVCAMLALGEGWHNGHHAFPTSARHGLAAIELDITYEFIRLLERFGWVHGVKVPSPGQRELKRRRPAPRPDAPPDVR